MSMKWRYNQKQEALEHKERLVRLSQISELEGSQLGLHAQMPPESEPLLTPGI